MTRKGKTPRSDIKSLRTAHFTHEKNEGQMFYETPTTFELWEETPQLYFVGKWRKAIVFEKVYTS